VPSHPQPPKGQTELLTWIPVELNEPDQNEEYLITVAGADDPGQTDVWVASYENGIWDLGEDHEGTPIKGPSDEIGVVAWAAWPKGYKS
jgi:hypothetical protein